jgi:DNA polymerase-3 subunit alpha
VPARVSDCPFCHLHVHSVKSFRDGLEPVENLVAKAAFLGQPGIALTDHGVLYGAPDLFKAAKDYGIKAVPGMEIYEPVPHAFDIERDGEIFKVKWADLPDGTYRYHHLTLWAMNEAGWLNLVELHSQSFQAEYHPSERGKPLIDRASMEAHNEGLMVGLGCIASRTNQALVRGDEDAAYEAGKWHAEVFEDRAYVEIHANTAEQIALQRGQRRLAQRLGIPTLGTNDVHYLDRKDGVEHGPHHTLVKSRRFKKADTEESTDKSDDGFGSWYGSDGFYMKSAQQMLEAGYPREELVRSVEILDRVTFDFDALPKPKPPVAVVPEPGEDESFEAFLTRTYEDEEALRRMAPDLVRF